MKDLNQTILAINPVPQVRFRPGLNSILALQNTGYLQLTQIPKSGFAFMAAYATSKTLTLAINSDPQVRFRLDGYERNYQVARLLAINSDPQVRFRHTCYRVKK